MKKSLILKGLSIVCSTLLIGYNVSFTYAIDNSLVDMSIEKSSSSGNAQWIQDGKVVYPVTQLDAEWSSFYLTSERVDACQIPQYIIESMTTSQLLQAVIDYPMYATLYMYDDMQTGYKKLLEYCNALKALLERENCRETVIENYIRYAIPEKRARDWSSIFDVNNPEKGFDTITQNDELYSDVVKDAMTVYAMDMMELILAEFSSEECNMSRIEEKEIIDVVVNKSIDKNNSELYEENNPYTYFDIACDVINNNPSASVMSVSSNMVMLKSPGGEPFWVEKCDKYTNGTSIDWVSYVKSIPGAKWVASTDYPFNCHSYAWLSKRYPSNYKYYVLAKVPSALYDDPKYTKYNNSPVADGDIAFWNNSQHSGIVVDKTMQPVRDADDGRVLSQYPLSPKIMSKWGGGPIVLHYLNAYEGFSCGVTYYHFK